MFARTTAWTASARYRRPLCVGLLAAVQLAGCGSTTPPCPATAGLGAAQASATQASTTQTPLATAASGTAAAGKATNKRGILQDVHGEELSTSPTGTTPESLRPWLGQLGAHGIAKAGLQLRFNSELAKGVNVRTSLDAAMHRQLEAEFANVERGAGVVINLSDGSIRALFSTLPHNADAKMPSRHLATSRPGACGSVAKPITAVAAFAQGLIKETTTHECKGHVKAAGRVFRCNGTHGNVDLPRALAISDNAFFFQIALTLNHNKLAKTQHAFGLGQPISLFPNAARGFVRTSDYFNSDGRTMDVGHTMSQAIGHMMRVTPLQVAHAYAALATGSLPTLTLRSAKTDDKHRAASPAATPLSPVYQNNLPFIREALRGSLTSAEGTAHFADVSVDAAGKTGTAQGEGHHDGMYAPPNHGWFAGWAPSKAPQIAFAFRIEGANGRATAKHVLNALAKMKLDTPTPR